MTDYPRHQLVLNVELDHEATLANFIFGKKNRAMQLFLQDELLGDKENCLYIWGASASGKSHLLQALCHEFDARGRRSIYLPLRPSEHFSPDILDNLEQVQLVCLDDIDSISGHSVWETALFNLYNRARDSGTILVIASTVPIVELSLGLVDLVSRLQASVVFQLQSLDDAEKSTLFKDRAKAAGINISQSVIDYVMLRSDRKVSELMQLLSRLEKQSLLKKRRITIPLVKQEMGW